MFSTKCVKFRLQDRAIIVAMLNQYKKYCTRNTAYLELLDLDKIDYVWKSGPIDEDGEMTGVLGSFTPLFPNRVTLYDYGYLNRETSLNAYQNGLNSGVGTSNHMLISIMTQVFPTCVHELIHMFQFGLNSHIPEPVTWKDILLFKVILPIGYTFNRLVTLFIDNPIVDGILKFMHRNDWACDTDKLHLPFIYKFTLEYDADVDSELCADLLKFSELLGNAITRVDWLFNNDPDNAKTCKKYDSYTEEDMKYIRESYEDMKKSADEEFTPQIMKCAKELVSLYDETVEKIEKK